MSKLTPQQKIAFYKQLDLGLSLGVTRVIDIFNDIVYKISTEKEQEFKDRIASMNKEIVKLKLEVKDGYTPIKGKDYFDGKPGEKPSVKEIIEIIKPLIPDPIKGEKGEDSTVPGPKGDSIQGIPGKDGSPDKPDEIIEKINTTKQSIEKKVVIGLEQDLKDIRQAIRDKKSGDGARKGGGGMGNWEHEVFSTSSATTTVTLARNVAAGGSAILVRYQGQLLAHGVQYTINGRVISFPFSLQDSTFVEVTYVRT